MSETHLEALNLNLLVALDALLVARNVTEAARRLGVTQSAASRSLAQLRVLLDDPLLVRHGSRMVPTPRAEALQSPLRDALDRLRLVLRAGLPFDPDTSAPRRFRLASTDLVAPLLLPGLQRQWPVRHDLVVSPLVRDRLVEDLEHGRVDVALGPRIERSGLCCEPLSEEPFAVALRAGHPCADALDLEVYAGLGHVLVSPLDVDDHSVVGRALAELGHTRRVVLRVPGFLEAPWALLGSDLVLTAPRRLLEALAAHLPLVVRDLPLEVPPLRVHALWHARWEADPAHRWFRERLVAFLQNNTPTAIPGSKGNTSSAPAATGSTFW
ncbi:MAG: LysR family transcriptional regulator [Alphaproteobacteria bacterium]|nr:LysR family transcriptional regulator [Alphaproteobacteria bacterium]